MILIDFCLFYVKRDKIESLKIELKKVVRVDCKPRHVTSDKQDNQSTRPIHQFAVQLERKGRRSTIWKSILFSEQALVSAKIPGHSLFFRV